MVLTSGLHTPSRKADWTYIPIKKWNRWQRIANRTNGVITPGNLISVTGAGLVIFGLIGLIDEIHLIDVSLIIIGRLADIADGKVADHTGTKSPLGEAVDATIDKILTFITLLLLIATMLIPYIVFALLFIFSVLNSLVAILAKRSSVSIHPNRLGKLSMALTWIIVIGYLVNTVADINVSTFLAILVCIYVLFSGHALKDYIHQLRRSS